MVEPLHCVVKLALSSEWEDALFHQWIVVGASRYSGEHGQLVYESEVYAIVIVEGKPFLVTLDDICFSRKVADKHYGLTN